MGAQFDAAELVARVSRLERQARRLRTIACLAGLGVVVLGMVAASSPKTVAAEQFVLRDGNGRTRAVLGMSNGGPRFGMSDTKGRMRLRLGLNNVGDPFVSLRDTFKNDQLWLTVIDNPQSYLGPFIGLMSWDYNGGVFMGLDQQDCGWVEIYNGAGQRMWSAP